ncbi:MAG TPA: pilus assembly protein TadG-related protein [Geobacteraceae bacterium]|nr:pilus assembly protein TadG-related protein [Geobacteraceae bacterium]
MDDREEQGMDTTYVGIMLVVFLVIAALAVDIGYLYVSEDDLQNAAETSALAGAQALKQRILAQMKSDPDRLKDISSDQVQASARNAAIDTVSGQHRAAALIEIANNNTNRLTTGNDVTVGFWNVSTHTYLPGGIPVNAIQVRTRRTAESESVGLGSLGSILAIISGPQKFNYTPEAIAAFPAQAGANFAVCVDACDGGCAYPNVCAIPERKMTRDAWDARKDPPASNRYAYTSLLYPPAGTLQLSDQVCMDLPPQAVCGKQIFTIRDADDTTLRDMASMMYNPNVDKPNKEYDNAGKVAGWWVIAPVTDCPPARQENVFEQHTVIKYALVRISRICVEGASGCQQNGTSFKAPSSACGSNGGLYIDHISCISCGSRSMPEFPGLRPVLVK